MTAYFGLLDIGKPQAGQTVVVSGAAGAVGRVVGQIARVHGCRVVRIAGGPEKCRYLVAELGFDTAIDHKSEDCARRCGSNAPKGSTSILTTSAATSSTRRWSMLRAMPAS
jgi:NADPH-dependent curcumin reductase CurA